MEEITLFDLLAMVSGAICVCVAFFGLCWLPEIVKAFL